MASDSRPRPLRSRRPGLRLAAACLALLPLLAGATVYHTDEEALRIAFPSATRFVEHPVAVDDALRARISARVGYDVRERLVVFQEAWQDDALLGRALVLEETGKTLPFRFLTAFTPAGAVDQVLLLTYRESRGQEIEREAFRKQYVGKTLADPIQRGSDIRNLTGATISVDSLSRGVRRALAYAAAVDAPAVAHAAPREGGAPE